MKQIIIQSLPALAIIIMLLIRMKFSSGDHNGLKQQRGIKQKVHLPD